MQTVDCGREGADITACGTDSLDKPNGAFCTEEVGIRQKNPGMKINANAVLDASTLVIPPPGKILTPAVMTCVVSDVVLHSSFSSS